MINLRQLFQKYRIEYKDRGPNVSRGNINISCILCGNADKSYHLGIREETGQWYCFRNARHHGPNIAFILKRLHIPYEEYKDLKLEEEEPVVYEDNRDYSAWQYFTPAEESEEALAYLESRLFLDPVSICRTFNLRVSKQGEWAKRILIPLTVGWTGRSYVDWLTLRYDAFTSENGFYLYKQKSTSCIVCEGALDCIRCASVSSQFDVIGKCRMALSPAILAYLREANYASIYVSPDASVPYSQARQEKLMVKSYCTNADVFSLAPPNGKKDFGESSESETRQLLSTLGQERMVI